MSDISNRLPGILDTAALRNKGGGGVKLFGLRLRSSGFSLSASPGKVAELQQNAKIAAEIVQGFDGKMKQLEDLGKQAENAAKSAADAYNGAIDRYNRAGGSVNAAADRYNQAQGGVQVAADRYNQALAEYQNAPEGDEGALDRFEAAKGSLEAAKGSLVAAKGAYEAADRELKNAQGAMNTAKGRYDAASADIKAVEDAIGQFQKTIPEVLASVGKQMGLEDVLVTENKRDANGNFTNDKMSFTDQASTLLQSWANSMKGGVELELRDSKGDLVKPEDDLRLVNPFTRERFKNVQIVGDKARITGADAMIVRNMGAISMFRKLFQSLMESLTATATRRHS